MFDKLFPIHRSIVNPGYNKSLKILNFFINFNLIKLKSGKKIFEKSKDDWNLEYKERKSVTSEDSFLLNIKKISKKNKKRYKKN